MVISVCKKNIAMLFEKIFLKSSLYKTNNKSSFIISCWDTIVPQFSKEDFEIYDTKRIILPSKEPNYLTVCYNFFFIIKPN